MGLVPLARERVQESHEGNGVALALQKNAETQAEKNEAALSLSSEGRYAFPPAAKDFVSSRASG